MYILFALLDGGVGVRIGDLGGLAKGAGDGAMDEAQDGDCAERDGDDGASLCQRDRDRGLWGTGDRRYIPVVGGKSDCDHFGICSGCDG